MEHAVTFLIRMDGVVYIAVPTILVDLSLPTGCVACSPQQLPVGDGVRIWAFLADGS